MLRCLSRSGPSCSRRPDPLVHQNGVDVARALEVLDLAGSTERHQTESAIEVRLRE